MGGINRYIMECKWKEQLLRFSERWELIDTLWNVNEVSTGNGGKFDLELIDTLWNVNDICSWISGNFCEN